MNQLFYVLIFVCTNYIYLFERAYTQACFSLSLHIYITYGLLKHYRTNIHRLCVCVFVYFCTNK